MTTNETDELRFGVLGPLEVRQGGRIVEIGAVKPRLLLAALLLNANRPVTFDRLIEAVWPTGPPRSAMGNLYTYVSGLRRSLPPGDGRISRGSTGYSIAVQPHELDLHTFEELAARAALRRAEGFREEALDLLQRAMALWRGEPLEDLPVGPALEADLARLVESRLTAAEERLALMVELGTYATAIAEAQAMLRENPFREQLWRHLMVALHRSGRRAEALRAYVDVRERLVEEMGVEPGPELRRTHA